jgi:CRP-like cAMP-binding protein
MNAPPRAVMKGCLDFVCLPEILRFLGANRCTGILRVRREEGRETGLVGLSGGELLNATLDGKSGMDALMAMFLWEAGEYEFFEKPASSRKVIRESTGEAVSRGLRLLESRGRAAHGKTGPGGESAPEHPGVYLIKGPAANYSYVVDEQDFRDGQAIVEQGSRGSWVSVILDGYADIVRETTQGPFTICRIGPGALIGDLNIVLNRENVRGATVRAVGEVTIGLLDLARTYTEFSKTSAGLRALFASLNRRWGQVSQCLVETHLGENRFSKAVEERTSEFSFNGQPGRAFLISAGSAVLLQQTEHGAVPLGVLGEGDFLGDVPFMPVGHEPHHAAVRVGGRFEVAPLDTAPLEKEYEESSAIVRSITEYISTCVSATTQILKDLHRRRSGSGRSV